MARQPDTSAQTNDAVLTDDAGAPVGGDPASFESAPSEPQDAEPGVHPVQASPEAEPLPSTEPLKAEDAVEDSGVETVRLAVTRPLGASFGFVAGEGDDAVEGVIVADDGYDASTAVRADIADDIINSAAAIGVAITRKA